LFLISRKTEKNKIYRDLWWRHWLFRIVFFILDVRFWKMKLFVTTISKDVLKQKNHVLPQSTIV
jgi:hypothetical protein